MEQRSFGIDLTRNEVYICGAILVTLLAFPEGSEETRAAFHASLCAKYLRDRYLGSEDENIPILMTPLYALRPEKDVQRDLKTLERRLRDRMIAAHVAIAFLRKAAGATPKLPPGITRLSVNQLTHYVSSMAGQTEQNNTESRIWRPSLPVIHLAAAVVIAINDGARNSSAKTSVGDILHSRALIEEIVRNAQDYEDLIVAGRTNGMPIDPARLIRVRLVSG